MTYEDYLDSIYYDPNHAGSFGGLEKLYRAVRKEGKYVLGRAKIRRWLQKQETYTLHQHVRRKFKRQRVIVPYMDYQWDADTAVMTSYSEDNDGFGFFLLVIGVFSRYVWTEPLQSTKGAEMVEALTTVLDKGRTPEKLRTDRGVEYKNRVVQTLMHEKGIDHFFTQNESKANFAERAIKTSSRASVVIEVATKPTDGSTCYPTSRRVITTRTIEASRGPPVKSRKRTKPCYGKYSTISNQRRIK